MKLTDQQATSILVEGLARGLFEPAVPAEEADRLLDATKLVEACETAHKNNNRSDNVNTILFIAKCDMNPDTAQVNATEIQQHENQITVEEAIADTSADNHMHNGLNLAELSDGILDQLIVGLDQYPQTDEVEVDRKAYTAEKERRNNGTGKGLEEDSPAQDPPETTEASGESTDQTPDTELQTGDTVSGEPGGQDGKTESGTGVHDQQNSGKGEDASAFARAQTPETSGKGKPSKAKAQEKDGERAELEAKLTYDMVKAHGTDLLSLSKAPIADLRYIVENPSGPDSVQEENAPKEEDKLPIIESQVVGVTNPELDKALGGIVPVKSVEQKIVTKADLNLGITEDESKEDRTGVSKDRETLESLLTGPCLKIYGRGRKEVPSIGDNELRLMVLNSSVKASDEEIQKAQMMDGKTILVEHEKADAAEQKDHENSLDPNVPEEVDRSIAEAAKKANEAREKEDDELAQTEYSVESTAEAPSQDIVITRDDIEAVGKAVDGDNGIEDVIGEIIVQSVEEKLIDQGIAPGQERKMEEENRTDPVLSSSPTRFAPRDNPTTNIELPSGQEVKVVTEIQKMPDIIEVPEEILAENKPLTGQARAMEIIEREGSPIPPEISEQAPVLPADVSKCSRDELFSYHARFHAYESRMNWVLSGFEDELGDIEKLRRVREIDVASSIPLLSPEDGKRITNEFRDAQVAADTLVIQYYEEEHEKKKTVNKLKVLQKNYHMDCERLSRQLSKYEREKQDAPR